MLSIPAADVVPGDLVHLHTGDRVPADARIVDQKTPVVRVDESSLTGEAEPAWKDGAASLRGDLSVSEQSNMVFSSTMVVAGSFSAVVTTTGKATKIGQISQALVETEDEDTPLKKALDDFGNQLANIIFLICIAVWVMNAGKFVHMEWNG